MSTVLTLTAEQFRTVSKVLSIEVRTAFDQMRHAAKEAGENDWATATYRRDFSEALDALRAIHPAEAVRLEAELSAQVSA